MSSINYKKCGRYFGYLFWMLIPRVITTVLTNINAPGLKIAGTALRIACEFVSVYILWQLKSEDNRFKRVSIFYAGVAVCEAVLLILQQILGEGDVQINSGFWLSVVFSLAAAVLSLLYIINIYPALSDILSAPSEILSKRWLFIRKLSIIGAILTFASVLMILAPVLRIFSVLTGVIIMLIAGIMDLVTMYKSSVACKNYDNNQINEANKALE